jgi:hypothetical protein
MTRAEELAAAIVRCRLRVTYCERQLKSFVEGQANGATARRLASIASC